MFRLQIYIFQIRVEPEGANSSPTPSPTSPTFATRKMATATAAAVATNAVATNGHKINAKSTVSAIDRPLKNGGDALPQEASDSLSSSDYIDTKTPYISRIIEQKSGKSTRLIKQIDDKNKPSAAQQLQQHIANRNKVFILCY